MQNVYIKQENNVSPFVKTIYTKKGELVEVGKEIIRSSAQIITYI